MRKTLIPTLWAALLGTATAAFAQLEQYPQPTNLPVIYITTSDGQSITSKDTYKTCTLVYRDGDSLAIYEGTKIRGRGNSTWANSDKKPYRIKFAQSQKFLGKGYAKSKSWTLLANAGDKSMLRNALTHDLGEFVKMKFSPAARFVDLYLNGDYRGTYQISDHINVDGHRVEVNDTTGYMFEFSQAADKSEEPHFQGQYGWIDVKNPDPPSEEQMEYAEQYFSDTRSRLLNSQFTTYADPRKGYRAMVDTTSLIKWYVASEITTNWDALYSVRAYMEQDSTLCFGPLWDEDLGWNNNSEIDLAEKLIGEQTAIPGYSNLRPLTALTRKLWQDPWFANAVTMRLNKLVKRGIKEYLLAKVDSLASVIEQSQQMNYQKWPLSSSGLANFDRYHSYRSYSQYVSQLSTLVSQRIDYLQSAFAERNKNNRYLDERAALPFSAESGVSVVLRRTVPANMWTSVCLPFSLSESEISRVFGDGARIASLTGVSEGVFEFGSVHRLEAGVPYLVRPTLDVDQPFSFLQVGIATTEPSTVTTDGCRFVGTFAPTTLDCDALTYMLDEGNTLVHPTSEANSLQGFRAYLCLQEQTEMRAFAVDGVIEGEFIRRTIRGDINRDGTITIADVTALVNIVLGKDDAQPYQYDHDAADVNEDGTITIADVTALVNRILGK